MIKLSAFADEAGDELDCQIDAMKKHGISLLELRSVGGKNVSLFSENEAKEMRRRLKDEGISVWSVGSPLGKTDIGITDNEWSEQVKRICGVADALQTDKVRAFSFFNAYAFGEKVIERLNVAAEIAKGFGVTLYHENEKEIYGDNKERVCELMQKLRGWKFIYDPANFAQVGETAENVLPLASKCDYYHIKDVIARTGELVPAGKGDCRIDKVLGSIEKDTTLTLEPHLAVFSAYSEIDGSELRSKYVFESNRDAFDAAAEALIGLLGKCGWRKTDGGYVKI